jgi:hypothetical protein
MQRLRRLSPCRPWPPRPVVSPMDSMLATASSMREAGRHLLAQADALESACLAQMEVESAYKAQMANFQQLRDLLAAIGKSGVA